MFMLPRAIVVAVVLTVVKEAFGSRTGIHKELYTTNAICRRHYCVNPIFPGLEDLHSLSQAKWVAASLQEAQPTMSFSRGAGEARRFGEEARTSSHHNVRLPPRRHGH